MEKVLRGVCARVCGGDAETLNPKQTSQLSWLPKSGCLRHVQPARGPGEHQRHESVTFTLALLTTQNARKPLVLSFLPGKCKKVGKENRYGQCQDLENQRLWSSVLSTLRLRFLQNRCVWSTSTLFLPSPTTFPSRPQGDVHMRSCTDGDRCAETLPWGYLTLANNE